MEEHQLAGHAWYTAAEAAGLVPLLHFDAHSDLSTPFGGSAEVGLGNLAYRNLWATRNDAFIIRVEAFVRGFVSELIWVGLSVVPSEGAMEIGTLLYDGEVMAPQTDTSSGKPEPVWCYPGRLHDCMRMWYVCGLDVHHTNLCHLGSYVHHMGSTKKCHLGLFGPACMNSKP